MRDESQNALLKTLEEPPEFVHLILLSSEPAALLETIASRCQPVDFAPLPAEAIEAALAGAGDARPRGRRRRPSRGRRPRPRPFPAQRRQGARARDRGRVLRRRGARPASAATAAVERAARRPPRRPARKPRRDPRGARGGEGGGVKRSAKEIGRRGEAGRAPAPHRDARPRPGALAAWFRDLAAIAAGAADVVYNRDRLEELRAAGRRASTRPPPAQAAELVQDTRRRLDLNVSEELALEASSLRGCSSGPSVPP